ncbi:MAG: spermidine synthase [Deltaproteobacteria bacterium]|nr:spermidine synthase [Deltaproteobacteria bacterium]
MQLVTLAAASLYFELAIIRFTSAEVLYLGYFSNFIMITAFLGLGIGFLSVPRAIPLERVMPGALLFLFALVLVAPFDVTALKNHYGLFYFGNIEGESGLPGVVLLVVLFFSTAVIFAGLGRSIGALFGHFTPLAAYTLDILGSLIGIGIFFLQSLGWSDPVVWILTGSALLSIGHLLTPAPRGARLLTTLATGAAISVLLLSSREPRVIWSMYQKLQVREDPDSGFLLVLANSIPHQFVQPASSASEGYYGIPYRLHREAGGAIDDVLIVGSGSGTDVAVALRAGARHVDAVEIDPGIVQLGKELHADRPYQDPRVAVHVTDGREYLRNTDAKYDLILFALPDSLMRVSSMSDVRLESYLFTVEAIADARERLKPGGTLGLYNRYRWEWLRNKIGTALATVFARSPRRVDVGPSTVFLVGDRIEGETVSAEGFDRLATDDWPFIYMQAPRLHWLYLGMVALFLLSAGVGVLLLAPRGTLLRPEWPFFFMGVAFLLLETKSISLFALLFGTTWMVNSCAFAGVLLSVLTANLIIHRLRVHQRWLLFALLLLALLLAYLVPARTMLSIDSALLRFLLSVVLIFSPIFLANLIFSREFRDTETSTRAFGWNLLGAVAGGGLEYLTLLTGQRNLLLIVTCCYVSAGFFLLLDSRRRRTMS